MYHILPMSKENVIGVRIEGDMSTKDYATLLPLLETLILKYGMIRVLVDLEDFKGVKAWGMIKSLPFSFKYASHVEKKAVITNQSWVRRLTKLSAPFFKTEVRCFSKTHTDEAWNWVRQ